MTKGDETHKDFVAAYFANGRNATQAYLEIKPKTKMGTAKVMATRLLTKVSVQTLIAEHEKTLQERFEIDENRVLREIARLSFFDIRQLYKADGSLKHPHEWDDDTAAAIAGMDVEALYERNTDGEREQVGTVRKFKIHSKPESLDKLMKFLGLFERDNKQKSIVRFESLPREVLQTIKDKLEATQPVVH